jgi:hypothetical protein
MGLPSDFVDSRRSFFSLSFATETKKWSFDIPQTSGITIAAAQDGTVSNSHGVIDRQLMVIQNAGMYDLVSVYLQVSICVCYAKERCAKQRKDKVRCFRNPCKY